MNRFGESQPEIYRLARSATLDAIEALGPHREVMDVRSLSSTDRRSFHTKVAGPAALLVAKAHKIQERLGVKSRERSKDAYDVYRLLRGFKTTILAERPGADRDGARPRETTPANRARGSYRTPENVGLRRRRDRAAHTLLRRPLPSTRQSEVLPKDSRMPGSDTQQRERRPFGHASALLPVAKCVDTDP